MQLTTDVIVSKNKHVLHAIVCDFDISIFVQYKLE